MSNLAVHFSSKTDNWATPQWLFDLLDGEFSFDFDVCADETNAKCSRYYDLDDDGLKQEWRDACWLNPPYGREIGKWVKKAYESSHLGATVVCLLPARTDTAWFHDYCIKGEVRLLRGRLKFGDGKSPAPFPSMIVIFRPPSKLNCAITRF
jgi:phage N-6-adenine-methyltransferase